MARRSTSSSPAPSGATLASSAPASPRGFERQGGAERGQRALGIAAPVALDAADAHEERGAGHPVGGARLESGQLGDGDVVLAAAQGQGDQALARLDVVGARLGGGGQHPGGARHVARPLVRLGQLQPQRRLGLPVGFALEGLLEEARADGEAAVLDGQPAQLAQALGVLGIEGQHPAQVLDGPLAVAGAVEAQPRPLDVEADARDGLGGLLQLVGQQALEPVGVVAAGEDVVQAVIGLVVVGDAPEHLEKEQRRLAVEALFLQEESGLGVGLRGPPLRAQERSRAGPAPPPGRADRRRPGRSAASPRWPRVSRDARPAPPRRPTPPRRRARPARPRAPPRAAAPRRCAAAAPSRGPGGRRVRGAGRATPG